MRRFTTDMGSLAYQNVYDLLELDEKLKYSPDIKIKEMPIAVRQNHDNLIDSLIDLSEVIHQQVVNWLTSTIMQARDLEDVDYADELLGGKLTEFGLLGRAKEIVRNTPGAPNIQKVFKKTYKKHPLENNFQEDVVGFQEGS